MAAGQSPAERNPLVATIQRRHWHLAQSHQLVASNILHRQQGRSTFVATHNQDRTLYSFFHIVGEDGIKRYPESVSISFTRARASVEVAKLLDVDRGAELFRIGNLLKLDRRRVVLD